MLTDLNDLTIVICIKEFEESSLKDKFYDYDPNMTLGKSYDVYYLNPEAEVYIIDDKNNPIFISDFREYFKTISDFRDEKIDDILG